MKKRVSNRLNREKITNEAFCLRCDKLHIFNDKETTFEDGEVFVCDKCIDAALCEICSCKSNFDDDAQFIICEGCYKTGAHLGCLNWKNVRSEPWYCKTCQSKKIDLEKILFMASELKGPNARTVCKPKFEYQRKMMDYFQHDCYKQKCSLIVLCDDFKFAWKTFLENIEQLWLDCHNKEKVAKHMAICSLFSGIVDVSNIPAMTQLKRLIIWMKMQPQICFLKSYIEIFENLLDSYLPFKQEEAPQSGYLLGKKDKKKRGRPKKQVKVEHDDEVAIISPKVSVFLESLSVTVSRSISFMDIEEIQTVTSFASMETSFCFKKVTKPIKLHNVVVIDEKEPALKKLKIRKEGAVNVDPIKPTPLKPISLSVSASENSAFEKIENPPHNVMMCASHAIFQVCGAVLEKHKQECLTPADFFEKTKLDILDLKQKYMNAIDRATAQLVQSHFNQLEKSK